MNCHNCVLLNGRWQNRLSGFVGALRIANLLLLVVVVGAGVVYIQKARGRSGVSKEQALGWKRGAKGRTLTTGNVGPGKASPKLSEAGRQRVVEAYGKLPLTFEANQGQTDGRVKFLSRGRGFTVFLTSREAVLAFSKSAGLTAQKEPLRTRDGRASRGTRAVVQMTLIGANPVSPVEGLGTLPGKSHYFLGNDPRKWRTHAAHYARVKYGAVYPGVDLIYYGHQDQLEYDFVVAPGANPGVIRLAFEGVEKVRVDAGGDLVLRVEGGEIRQKKPLLFQEVDGVKREIAGRYVIERNRQVSFRVGRYDAGRPLTIDPVLTNSSYFGGSGEDYSFGVAVDSFGDAYLTGTTASSNFPAKTDKFQATPAGADAFVAKLNAGGSALVYSTYFGGSGNDQGSGIAVDALGNAYVTGFTRSANFPTTPNAFQARFGGGFWDAFVAKVKADGSALVYSTYLGGSGDDWGLGIALDSSGNAYLTGVSSSANFPVTSGAFQRLPGGGDSDAFVTKLNATGSALVYSTYLGGIADDQGRGIAVDAFGSAYVTGNTRSTNFPTTPDAFQQVPFGPGYWDAFVAKLKGDGSALVYSTYLGGSSDDWGLAIALDASGNAYLTGFTWSDDFPVTSGAFQGFLGGGNSDAFATKLNATGSALAYSTYLGASADDQGNGIAVDALGNAYVTGNTRSMNFPITSDAFQTASAGHDDAFLTILDPTGTAVIYSTYIGGQSGSGDDQGSAVALDSSGNVYVTGTTGSTDLAMLAPLQATYSGNRDAFLVRIAASNPALSPPNLQAGGIVNAASFNGTAVAPGSIASVFGTKLATSSSFAVQVPLPTALGGARLRFNNTVAVPKFFASPTQINFQVPWELAGQAQASLTATIAGLTSGALRVPLADFAPGLFSVNSAGSGQGAILIASTGQVAAPSGSILDRAARPANRGEFAAIFCTGLGPVTNQPLSGAVARSNPLSTTTTIPAVTVGGVPAPVTFSGLAPNAVGLYQVNLQVPPNAPRGAAVPVVLRIGGATSNTVTMAVE